MNTSGDAAEQIVRMSLEGTEIALRLSGAAAKNIAAMLYAALKDTDKTKTHGRQRLAAMMKSGKQLKVFTVSRDHLKLFAKEAKRYGVVYCALRGKSEDGMVDILVRAEDSPKINRIVERFKLITVDAATVEKEPEKITEIPVTEDEIKSSNDLLDDLLGVTRQENPQTAQAEKSAPSAPISTTQRAPVGTSEKRPSVREAMREIRETRNKFAAPEVAKEVAERIPVPKISAKPRER